MSGRMLMGIALVLSGCVAAVRVHALDPRPNVDLPASPLALGLDLRSVPDAFTVPENQGVTEVPIENWHGSLRAGFDNGIAPFFARKPKADLWLRFVKVDLEYTPVAVYVRSGGAAAVKARVSYLAQIVDREGRVLSRMKGEALSRNPWTTYGGSMSTAEESIAKMFEDIADEGLRTLGATTVVAAAECEDGQVMHPSQQRCVSACNPGCAADERCTGRGTCVKSGVTTF